MPQQKAHSGAAQLDSEHGGGGYHYLAEHYDELFRPFQSVMNKARRAALGRVLRHVRTACDLGAGTGTAALDMAEEGIRVYAIDASAEMCRVARRKVKQAGAAVKVLHADMRSFSLPEAVDLVTCEGDALNHIPHASDLAKVARSVFRALRPGGWFFFDVNNSLGFTRYWTGTVFIEKPGLVAVMRNGHRRDGRKAWSDIDLFVRKGTTWRRHSERVSEVSWTEPEIRRALRQAGFDTVRTWDASPFFGGKSVVALGCRTIYLAHKPKNAGELPIRAQNRKARQ